MPINYDTKKLARAIASELNVNYTAALRAVEAAKPAAANGERVGREVRKRLAVLGITARVVTNTGYVPKETMATVIRGTAIPDDPSSLEHVLGWQEGSVQRILDGQDPIPVFDVRGDTKPGEAVVDWPRKDRDWKAACEQAWADYKAGRVAGAGQPADGGHLSGLDFVQRTSGVGIKEGDLLDEHTLTSLFAANSYDLAYLFVGGTISTLQPWGAEITLHGRRWSPLEANTAADWAAHTGATVQWEAPDGDNEEKVLDELDPVRIWFVAEPQPGRADGHLGIDVLGEPYSPTEQLIRIECHDRADWLDLAKRIVATDRQKKRADRVCWFGPTNGIDIPDGVEILGLEEGAEMVRHGVDGAAIDIVLAPNTYQRRPMPPRGLGAEWREEVFAQNEHAQQYEWLVEQFPDVAETNPNVRVIGGGWQTDQLFPSDVTLSRRGDSVTVTGPTRRKEVRLA